MVYSLVSVVCKWLSALNGWSKALPENLWYALVFWKHITLLSDSYIGFNHCLDFGLQTILQDWPHSFPFVASHLNVPCFHWWTSVSVASAGCGQGKAVGRLRDVLDRRHSCRPSYQAPPKKTERIWAGSSYLFIPVTITFIVAQT